MSAVDEFLTYDAEHGITKTAGPILGMIRGGLQKMLNPEAIAAGGAQLGQAVMHEAPAAGEALAKKPGFWEDMLKPTLKGTAAVGLAGAATGAALGTAEKLWDLASNTISKVHGFHTMMQANPELDKMDRQKVHTVYSTLHRFNPEMARDPFVSGAWVKKLTEYDYVDPKTVGDLISARSKTTGGDFFQRGVQLAQQGSQFGALEAAKAYAKDQATRNIQAAHGEEDLQAAMRMSAAQQLGKDVGTGLTAPTAEQERQAIQNKALWEAQGRGEYAESPDAQNAAFQTAFQQAAGKGAYEESLPAALAAQRKARHAEWGKIQAEKYR